jgi:hypothetical protein
MFGKEAYMYAKEPYISHLKYMFEINFLVWLVGNLPHVSGVVIVDGNLSMGWLQLVGSLK